MTHERHTDDTALQSKTEAAMTLIPTPITFHGLAHSDEIESDIRERVRKLEQFYGEEFV